MKIGQMVTLANYFNFFDSKKFSNKTFHFFCLKLNLLCLFMSGVSLALAALALCCVFSTCWMNVRRWSMVTPRYFAVVFHGMLFPLILRCCIGAILSLLPFTQRILLLSTLIAITSQPYRYYNMNSFFFQIFYVFFVFIILCASNLYTVCKVLKANNVLVTYVKRKTIGCALQVANMLGDILRMSG